MKLINSKPAIFQLNHDEYTDYRNSKLKSKPHMSKAPRAMFVYGNIAIDNRYGRWMDVQLNSNRDAVEFLKDMVNRNDK